jgi:ribonuclease P protein subunit POP4
VTPVTANNLIRHELIGLEARVKGGSNKCQNKIRGIIINETRNTLIFLQSSEERQIAKCNASFIFNLKGTLVEVEGKTLIGRPEDRVKKKQKRDW